MVHARACTWAPSRVDVQARFLDSHDIIFILKTWPQLSNELCDVFPNDSVVRKRAADQPAIEKTTTALFSSLLPAHANTESLV